MRHSLSHLKKRFTSVIAPLAISLALLATQLTLCLAADWDEASSGNHSYLTLGPEYSVPLSVKPAPNARLVLFNPSAAQHLGLALPEDPKALEKLILDHFAFQIDPEGHSPHKLFATRYQDSNSKAPGEALGDGRAAWSGEIRLPQANGKTAYVDVVIKGIGQTPLAWTNHPDKDHSDGLQSIEEAVHSFVMSEANFRNQLDSTVDLAVIQIGKAAITVRVGNQTRVAHPRYFSDNPAEFKKIFEYTVRRDLGLALDASVGKAEVQNYLKNFAENLGEEAARYFDLHAVHASPTQGNRTTQGSTIDMGTFRYLDAHHGEYDYLFEQLKLSGQTDQMRDYISSLKRIMTQAKYPHAIDDAETAKLKDLFLKTAQAKMTEHWLTRLGLSPEDVTKLPLSAKRNLFEAVMRLASAEGHNKASLGKKSIVPAAFDVRKILKGTIEVLALPSVEQDAAWKKLFENERSWNTLDRYATQREEAREYINAVKALYLEARLNQAASRGPQEWIARAHRVGAVTRAEPGLASFQKHRALVADIYEGKKDFSALTSDALTAIDSLVDYGLSQRQRTNLGKRQRIGVMMGTFDPPHAGHLETIRNTKESLGLDILYVVPNVDPQTKPGATPYELRKEMARLAFAKEKGITVADRNLEAASAKGSMNSVLRRLEQLYPEAELFQIMGEDRFESRAARAKESSVKKLTLVVAQRGEGRPSTLLAGTSPVIFLENGANLDTSSSAIRKQLAMGEVSPDLAPAVSQFIQKKKLYSIPKKDSLFKKTARCLSEALRSLRSQP